MLDVGGALALTVPTVLGRLTRSRAGLPASYHGAADANDPQMLVHTEFGADLWVGVFEAGFTSCELVTFSYPAGLAIIGRHDALVSWELPHVGQGTPGVRLAELGVAARPSWSRTLRGTRRRAQASGRGSRR